MRGAERIELKGLNRTKKKHHHNIVYRRREYPTKTERGPRAIR